ncbi:MAG: hypothetical protein SPC78_05800 [Candidatus Faecousia sp.]|nr:hypothetical protein [Candidatus Faecousia sp.]
MSKKMLALVMAALIVLSILLAGCANAVGAFNQWAYEIRKTDDATRYSTRKKVEDTCRATIVSYQSDRLTWEQYKDSESQEQRGWADAAKIRANKAAVTYNEYFLKNSYVFEGNVPGDILQELPLIE